MKLLYSVASPYARFVRIVARYLNLKLEEVSTNPFDNSEQLTRANPLAQIPCLLLDDGSALYDSEVIGRYLDVTYGGSQLFGVPGTDWHAQCQFALIKGLIDSAVKLRQEQMREEEGVRSAFWTARFEEALRRGVQELDTLGLGVTGQPNASTMALVCLLDYLDFRHAELNWRQLAPNLALWFTTQAQLSPFIETRPC